MTKETPRKRGYFLTIFIALLGTLSIADYLHEYSFHTHDLLKGLGFLLAVPSAYLCPSVYSLKQQPANIDEPTWAKYLSYVGVLLIVAGFTLQWI